MPLNVAITFENKKYIACCFNFFSAALRSLRFQCGQALKMKIYHQATRKYTNNQIFRKIHKRKWKEEAKIVVFCREILVKETRKRQYFEKNLLI